MAKHMEKVQIAEMERRRMSDPKTLTPLTNDEIETASDLLKGTIIGFHGLSGKGQDDVFTLVDRLISDLKRAREALVDAGKHINRFLEEEGHTYEYLCDDAVGAIEKGLGENLKAPRPSAECKGPGS